ncbi:hypothetical protein SDC9_97373 [bioreactor metagenome]|uniref:Uncharacterized protein n=1 Tax=bioreactor metagenome TaxID=1076179 RepID=A0A645AEB8_9ZZZZ
MTKKQCIKKFKTVSEYVARNGIKKCRDGAGTASTNKSDEYYITAR